MRHNLKRILATLFGNPWLITREALEGIAEIVDGHGDIEAAREIRESKEAALLAAPGVELPGAGPRARIVDGIAVLEVDGPIYRRADFFQAVSGATSLESLARDLRVANENEAVRAIILNINSPGGSVNGVDEFAELIRRNPKPVHAFAGGICCSAAYWIGSAAESLTVGATALVGSIGVISMHVDDSERNEREGRKVYKFRSSQSPNKNLDPSSPEGRDAEQVILDGICATFIERVARNRGVTVARVQETFGQGGVVLGQEAVRRKMADRIALLDDLIADLSRRYQQATGQQDQPTTEQPTMNEEQPAPEPGAGNTGSLSPDSDDAQLYMLEGIDQERKRIRTIFESPAFRGIRAAIGDKYFARIFDDGATAQQIVWEVMESRDRLAADLRDGLNEDARTVSGVGSEPAGEDEAQRNAEDAMLEAMLEGARDRGAA